VDDLSNIICVVLRSDCVLALAYRMLVAGALQIQQLRKSAVRAGDPPRFLDRMPFALAMFGNQAVHASVEIAEIEQMLCQKVHDSRDFPVSAIAWPFHVDLRASRHSMSCGYFEGSPEAAEERPMPSHSPHQVGVPSDVQSLPGTSTSAGSTEK
jgi:hypothetical protein